MKPFKVKGKTEYHRCFKCGGTIKIAENTASHGFRIEGNFERIEHLVCPKGGK